MLTMLRDSRRNVRGGSGFVRTVRAIFRELSSWTPWGRPGGSQTSVMAFHGGYSSGDGRMESKESRIFLATVETDDGTGFGGYFDGLLIRDFRSASGEPWEFQWEVRNRGMDVTVRGFVAGTDALYTHFRYPSTDGSPLPLDVYGEYRLRK